MKLRVLLDMDGVIADFYHEFASFLNSEYGCNLDPFQEPSHYSFSEWGHGTESIDMSEASDRWIRQGGIANIPPFEGAADFVKKLMSVCNVYIVTARVGDWNRLLPEDVKNSVKEDTENWLIEQGLPTDNLHFCHKKVDFCKDNAIQLMIEDKMSTALEAAKNGISTILMDRGYNQSPIDRFKIHRALSYDDVFDLLEKIT